MLTTHGGLACTVKTSTAWWCGGTGDAVGKKTVVELNKQLQLLRYERFHSRPHCATDDEDSINNYHGPWG